MKTGSLCTGYAGLDFAVEAHWPDAELAWVSEIDGAACKLLAHRFPDVPNLGDLTTTDWARVEPVDILTAGYPCQPFSQAGQRKGTADERHIWPHISNAIGVLRPRLVVLENVAGHLSLGGPAVIAGLTALGYDARWLVVRASDVGACHRRARLFIVASDGPGGGHLRDGATHAADADRAGPQGHGRPEPDPRELAAAAGPAQPAADTDRRRLEGREELDSEPQIDAAVGHPCGRHADGCCDAAPDATGELGDGRRPGHDAPSCGIEGLQAPPRGGDSAPPDANGTAGRAEGGASQEVREPGAEQRSGRRDRLGVFGPFGAAVARHERALGRLAPAPVVNGKQLNPVFVEWMMMLPDGWVCDVPGLSRTQRLKLLGNGVVPAQAARALALLTPVR